MFKLEAPIDQKKNSECLCGKKLKESTKNYCHFCGAKACDKCCYKTREFQAPKQQFRSGNPKPKEGKVCKTCDKKFMLRDMAVPIAQKMKESQKQVEALTFELTQKEAEIMMTKNDLHEQMQSNQHQRVAVAQERAAKQSEDDQKKQDLTD